MAREPESIDEQRRALGELLAAFRKAANLTQGQLANLAFHDRTKVTHIENGRARADERFWQACDDAVNANGALVTAFHDLEAAKQAHQQHEQRIRLAQAQARASSLSTNGSPTLEIAPGALWAEATRNAVLNPVEVVGRAMVDQASLTAPGVPRVMVNRAIRTSLTSDFGALGRSLPSLIGVVEAHAMQPAGDRRASQQALSDVYTVVGWTLIKADALVEAWIAAGRAIEAAERADDVVRMASATRCLAEVHMRAGNLEEATRTAFLATVQLSGATPEDHLSALSTKGAALLSAAAASARRGDAREAHAALRAATVCADELGHDRADLGTVFGPTNVAIHRVAVAIELGDAREAIKQIPRVKLDRLPDELTERRSRFLIDVARSYEQVGDDQAAIDALIEAERTAPGELRHHRLTRQIVPRLVQREHRSSDLRGLAERCALLN